MARDFVPGTTDYLQYNGAIVTAVPFTLACWVNPDTVGNYGLINIANSADAAAFTGWLLWLKNVTSTLRASVAVQNLSSYGEAVTTATLSTGSWAHICGVFAAADSRTIYLNGGNSVTDASNRTPATVNKTTLGAYYYDGALSGYLDGKLGEAAIWNVGLTAAEVAILALGYSPSLVRPASLVSYWPIIGKTSPEIDLVGTFPMTIGGAPASTAHTRVFYPGMIGLGGVAGTPPSPFNQGVAWQVI